MSRSQAPTSTSEEAGFTLHTERLGPLPLINHFIERIGLHDTLSRHVPSDSRCTITHASALGVLLRSISFCGSYRSAQGRQIRKRTAPLITDGHSKAHRPDLKQLLFILTMSADGHVPVACRCADGSTSDSVTHVQTGNTLK